MEMRVLENVSTGEDLSPPLKPIAFVLHDRYLATHCSACFNKLPEDPVSSFAPEFPQNSQRALNDDGRILYCSTRCSSLDSPLHSSSAEAQLHSVLRQSPPSTWLEENASSDLRLSLRLSRRLAGDEGRNGKIWVSDGIDENPVRENAGCEEIENESSSGRIVGCQRLLIGGKRTSPLRDSGDSAETRELERIGGLMSNRERLMIKGSADADDDDDVAARILEGVKFMTKSRRLCRDSADDCMNGDSITDETILCIVMTNAVEVHDESGLSIGVAVYGPEFSWINHSCSPNACYRFSLGTDNEMNSYGPRVILRSIKPIQKGEEATIAYTDLLQPKNMRKRELWLKYRFSCSCHRCKAVPASSVDSALQMLIAEEAHEELMDIYDDAVSEYLQSNDPKTCITKLENLLKSEDENTGMAIKLHPLNHISLNAYTALSSAYKAQAINSSSNDEALLMYKTSAAYSLLLALATNHLFAHEPSLIASAANFMKDAGESLLKLTWDSFLGKPGDNFSYILTSKYSSCSLTGTLAADFYFEETKSRFVGCISGLASKAWGPLAAGNSFLGSIGGDPSSSFLNVDGPRSITESWLLETDRVNLVLLGVHCLRYGALLSNVCYGSSPEMYYRKCLTFMEDSLCS